MLVGLRVLGETNWGPISQMTNMMQVIFGGDRARQPDGQHGVERHDRHDRRRIRSADAGLQGRLHDRLVAEEHDDHAAAGHAGRRRGRLVDVSAAPRHLRHRRRERRTGVADLAPPGRALPRSCRRASRRCPPAPCPRCSSASRSASCSPCSRSARSEWVPSPTGTAIGMLVPASVIIVMFLGSVVDMVWRRVNRAANSGLHGAAGVGADCR